MAFQRHPALPHKHNEVLPHRMKCRSSVRITESGGRACERTRVGTTRTMRRNSDPDHHTTDPGSRAPASQRSRLSVHRRPSARPARCPHRARRTGLHDPSCRDAISLSRNPAQTNAAGCRPQHRPPEVSTVSPQTSLSSTSVVRGAQHSCSRPDLRTTNGTKEPSSLHTPLVASRPSHHGQPRAGPRTRLTTRTRGLIP